jgi:hypothetical protein
MSNSLQQHIADALSLDSLSPEEQQEMLLRAGAVIYQNVLIRVLEVLSDTDQDEFEKLLDSSASQEELFGFLKLKVPGLETIVKEEAQKFKNKSSDIMGQIGN